MLRKRPVENGFTLSRWTIQVKLIGITSLILLFFISGIIILTTYFFKNDSEVRIKENSLKVAQLIGHKVRSDFNSIVEKSMILANAMAFEKITEEKKEELQKLFFRNDKNFVYLGVFKEQGRYLKSIRNTYNLDYILENRLEESDLERLVYLHANVLQKAFNGEVVLHNVSQGFPFPIIAISVPYLDMEGEKSILISLLRVEKILNVFDSSSHIKAFMVNSSGIAITHPDANLVLSSSNLSDTPLVERFLNNKAGNGQMRYKDKRTGEYYLGSYAKVAFADAGVMTYIPENIALEEVYNIQKRNLYILAIALCSAILIVLYFAKSITGPVLSLVDASRSIEKGVFKLDIKPQTRDEIGLLTNSFLTMGLGLEEREKVKSILGSMIDPVVVKEAMKDLATLKRGNEKIITAFFSDVASFSTISEKLTSAELASLLNEYLSAMTIILKEHEGVLDKYIGDAIVGIFNAPVEIESHSLKAARASVRMMEKLKELRTYWSSKNLYCREAQLMDIRIGLNTGTAKVGFMGTDALASYTMMGDTVNLAARLEAAAKDYGVNILISEAMQRKVDEVMHCRHLDLVRVKGKNEPVKVYELIGEKANLESSLIESVQLYEEGIRYYLMRNWKVAIQKFSESEKVKGKTDKAVKLLLERCEEYTKNPPPEDWDGVFTRTHK